jgi:pyruvate,water dikinase
MKIEPNHWYKLKVEVKGFQIKGYVDDEAALEYRSDKPVQGYVGLWTKADSVTAFRKLRIEKDNLSEKN